MNPLSLSELADILDGRLVAAAAMDDACIERSVSIDSRTLQAGEIFVALAGRQQHGCNFVRHALEQGASAAVVERPVDVPLPQIVVADSRTALWRMACWQKEATDALIIAITGSVGKTSTRNMLHGVLAQQYRGRQSPQNYNNELGVPLSLLQITPADEFAVIEIAANGPGEIARLSALAAPEIGILTSVGPAHLEGFGSLSGVIQEKSQLLAALPESGLTVIPGHLAHLPDIRKAIRTPVVTVGSTPDNNIVATEIACTAPGLEFNVDGRNFRLAVQGTHLLNSALMCLAVGRELGMDDDQIQSGFDRFQSVPGRGEIKQTSFGCLIDDSYNANPLSMAAGLDLLRHQQGVQRRIAVLGDMAELGAESVALHRKVGHRVAHGDCDYLITYGSRARDMARGAHAAGMSSNCIACFDTIHELLPILSLWLAPGTAVLVKGSRSMHMEAIVSALEASDQRQWQAAAA
ncbi:UDP-N-acetylmuramoyl-tripeptide--D-alanyl-D-alanine ligase [Rubinisphaera margarita]|uniref:UDP-N-acetylmuramoyl-tripeptide--D-alanyl-D- alanine ligase n=1 Tax=Rubinisphaera margarita TaxID=2909586 RepID=UPI001EE7AFBB|nr:UDP-N-acetylmuramoyl-tripeptide--D-alanyl-D-alanine ligase [Rubinisphaera margarita]MCG6156230.1 UDP-N-acetylmuramoyl-tripeptide--D-alanyl-D-alanine ligase [Rubinisphaera margarita]